MVADQSAMELLLEKTAVRLLNRWILRYDIAQKTAQPEKTL
jgi:hypothetical protein